MSLLFVLVVIAIFVTCFVFISMLSTMVNVGVSFVVYKASRAYLPFYLSLILSIVFSFCLAANIKMVDYFNDFIGASEEVIVERESAINLVYGEKIYLSTNLEEISFKSNLMDFPVRSFSGASMSTYYSVPAVKKEIFKEILLNKGLSVSSNPNEKISIVVDVKSNGYVLNTTYAVKKYGKTIYEKKYVIRKMYRGEAEYFDKRESGFWDMFRNYSLWSEIFSQVPLFKNKADTFYDFLDQSFVVEKETKNSLWLDAVLTNSANFAVEDKYLSIGDVTHCNGFDIITISDNTKNRYWIKQFVVDNKNSLTPVDTFNSDRVNFIYCKDNGFLVVDFDDYRRDLIELYEYTATGKSIGQYVSELPKLDWRRSIGLSYFDVLNDKFIVGFKGSDSDKDTKRAYFELRRAAK